MSEAMWVWDYELKTLGSWPSTGYNGHNTPVEVVTQMDVKTLRDERDRLRANLVNCVARLEAYYGEDYPAVRDAKAALTPAKVQMCMDCGRPVNDHQHIRGAY